MKKILNVVNLENENDVEKIKTELKDSRLNYEISFEHKAVIIYGGADEHRVAVLAIRKAGFEVL